MIGDTKNGLHLIMEPEGFGVVDYHYQTIEEAKEDASKLFGIESTSW
ncbi:hypothetical protein [Aliikangiella coralliicola]|nr:hypothetical protein [Aliikangiella coralliicola]